ncbi:hypothetical protein GJV85_01090 [Sulfurimonas aquatica]|uniref:Uncharacterized protein n=1 Tax=Sulfurimonas aquatica TaxID=2672570 RepID=A0A975AYA3_9BACT|nr:hypothetical protein [Sulfurimonas aquatica]QSZ40769.1 hypothetical protein GJV85_01090 [Sulfurimonas aquatica]
MLMANMQDDISDVELKQRWRLFWIHSVFEFSNLKLQKMSWIEASETTWPNDEPWFSSFEECLSSYFDILALDDTYAKALKSANVSQEEVDNASKFHQLAYLYIEPSEDPRDILEDPEWIEVTLEAKKFWNYLKATVASQREIELIKKLEQEYA